MLLICRGLLRCIMVMLFDVKLRYERGLTGSPVVAIAEAHGDTAVLLIRAGAEADKRDSEDMLAIDLAPDDKVRSSWLRWAQSCSCLLMISQVRRFIVQAAERDGIDLSGNTS